MKLLDWLLELFDPQLHIEAADWAALCEELHRKTGGVHESGAFLLGRTAGRRRYVSQVIFYDELADDAYATGVVRLEAPAFTRLWAHCRETSLEVVGDIHVHPCAAFQSNADRDNPMIAVKGHIALILADFAEPPIRTRDVAMYQYLGSHRWRNLGGAAIGRRLKIR